MIQLLRNKGIRENRVTKLIVKLVVLYSISNRGYLYYWDIAADTVTLLSIGYMYALRLLGVAAVTLDTAVETAADSVFAVTLVLSYQLS